MAVDQARQHNVPSKFVYTDSSADPLRDLLVAAYRDQPVAFDREGFGDRASGVLGQQSSAAQYPVGGTDRGSGHGVDPVEDGMRVVALNR